MNTTIKIFLRTDQTNIDGTNTVCLRLTIKRKIKLFSLQIKVFPNNWHFSKNIVKKSDIDYFRKNKYITKYENKAKNIIDNYFLNDKQLTFYEFKQKFRNKSYDVSNFYSFAEAELENKTYAKATNRTYKVQISKLKQYRKNLDINDIDFSFIEGYKKYMIETLKNKPSTWNKSLTILRTFVNWAIDKEIIEKNPFEKVKIKNHKGNRTYLKKEELTILENIRTSDKLNKNDKTTLDYFLFACYTGLRYTDVKRLKHKHIKNNTILIDMHKTGKPVEIPLLKKANKFINKTQFYNKKVFNVACNQVTNKRLKKIIYIAGIDKKISFHCARHTFATVGISLGIPIVVISNLLGHTGLKTTQIYIKIENDLKRNELEKME